MKLTNSEIKQILDKFREISQTHPQMNKSLVDIFNISIDYCSKNYRPSDLINSEIKAIIEASEVSYNLFVQAFKRSNFDSSIYSLCCLGAAYAADKYMYVNNIKKVMLPLAIAKNEGMTDNDYGEIKAFINLIDKFGKPTDLK